MKKRILICVLFLCSMTLLPAQNLVGLKASFGVSRITNNFLGEVIENPWKIRMMPSAQVGIFLEHPLGDWGKIGIEGMAEYLGGKYTQRATYTNEMGQNVGSGDTQINLDMFYFSLPVWFGMDFGKWTANLGLKTSFTIGGTYRETGQGEINGSTYTFDNSIPIRDPTPVNWGPRLAAIYHVSDHIGLEASLYHGIRKVADGFGTDRIRPQQLLTGLRVRF